VKIFPYPSNKIIAVLALTVLVYANSLNGGFVWDDSGLIAAQVEYFEDLGNLSSLFLNPHFEQTPYYRPLLWASFFFDYYIWGINPLGFHITNTVLHIFDTLLVYQFILCLGFSAGIAWFAAALFATHPVQTEAVAWIAGRNDPLMMLFLLLSLVFLLQARQTHEPYRKTGCYALSCCSFACSLLTKETAVVMVPLLALIDFFYQKDSWSRQRRGETIFVYGLLGVVVLCFLLLRRLAFTDLGSRFELQTASIATALTTPLAVYCYYLKVLFFPVNLTVAPSIPCKEAFLTPRFIACYLLLVCLIIGGVWRKFYREGAFGMLWILLYLLPVSGVIWMGVPILEHRLYGASIGFCLMLSVACNRYAAGTAVAGQGIKRNPGYGIAVFIVILYSLLTVERNRLWQNDVSVWSDTVKKSPNSVTALNNLGSAQIREKKYDDAINYLNRALKISPAAEKAYGNLGLAYSLKKEYGPALAAYQKVLTLNPRSAETCSNIGMIFRETGDYVTALAWFGKALEIKPDFAQAYLNRGLVYYDQGDKQKAIAAYQTASQLAPHSSYVHNTLGLFYMQEGDAASAFKHYETALSLDASNYEALNNIALLYIKQKLFAKALPFLTKAAALRPSSPEIYLNTGIVFFNIGKPRNAIQEYKKALDLNPSYVEAHFNIAAAYLLFPEEQKQAQYHFKQVLALDPDYPHKALIEQILIKLNHADK
jgi:tetratricopeptide (TPR) repeat protein